MPSNKEVSYQQKMLAMYRALLAEYLRQNKQWDIRETPTFLQTGISTLRHHIMEVKGILRGWKVAVNNHSDDEGSNEDLAGKITHQRRLLKIYRENLSVYLKRRESYDEEQVPLAIIHSINEARSDIQRIKAILRGWNVEVEDMPGEE